MGPFNLENKISSAYLNSKNIKDIRAKQILYTEILRQILKNLASLHEVGIVHRDVKPQNMILSDLDEKVKMIDLGAAADLRIGINYEPNEYLLDPRYAPPQQFIMSTSTPRAPPSPLAALLSPILWKLNNPDRFDMYSVGIVLIQIVFPSMRNDTSLFSFNNKFSSFNYDIETWKNSDDVRTRCLKDSSFREGFELLSLDNNSGWDILRQLLALKPSERISAQEALSHPFCSYKSPKNPFKMTYFSAKKFKHNLSTWDWIMSKLDKQDQLTEAMLLDELAQVAPVDNMKQRGSATQAFWRSRQAVFEKKLQDQRPRSQDSFRVEIFDILKKIFENAN